MKRIIAFLLVAVLAIGLIACDTGTQNGETKAENTEATAATEPATAEPETEEPETEAPETVFEPGLFEGEYTYMARNISGDASLNLQADARFYCDINLTDLGFDGNNTVGNYVVKDGKLYTYTWFTQNGDTEAQATPDIVDVYDIVDENTLSLLSESATVTYKRVTDQARVDAFTESHSIYEKLANSTLLNDHGSPTTPTENPAKALSVYEYKAAEGQLRSVKLVLFEDGRYYTHEDYDDGSAGFSVFGSYYFKDDCFWCQPWFTGGFDLSITLTNRSSDRFLVMQDGKLVTSAFQGYTDGLDITLELNENADLDYETNNCGISGVLKTNILINH